MRRSFTALWAAALLRLVTNTSRTGLPAKMLAP